MDHQEPIEDVPHYYTERPSAWPAMWGAVAIIFGMAGAILQVFSALQNLGFLMMGKDSSFSKIAAASPSSGNPEQDKMMAEMMESQEKMFESMADQAPVAITISIILIFLAILLVVGGIMLCMRKRIASPTLQIWAVLKIIAGGVGVWYGFKLTHAMMGSYGDLFNAASSSGPRPSGMPDMGRIFGIFSNVMFFLSFIWVAILPTFFLIWFNRESVKHDMKHGLGW